MTISNKKPPKRRFSREESGLRYDIQQFYSMKVVLEQLFGKPTYQRLKETASLKDWKDSTSKLLKAIELSIKVSVSVADDDWREAIAFEIQHGLRSIQFAEHMDEVFCSLSAALTRIVFTQIGQWPRYYSRAKTVPLTEDFWILNSNRSAQYVQTAIQKENATRQREEREAKVKELQLKYPTPR